MTLRIKIDALSSEQVLTDFALGKLSPAKHMMVRCQREMSLEVTSQLAFQEQIAAAFIDDMPDQNLSDDFLQKVLTTLPDADDETQILKPDDLPPSLRNILGKTLQDMEWKDLVPNVAIHDIMGSRKYDTERLYLMRVGAGMKMPEHSHTGEEWTLILSGSYHIDDEQFTPGDLHIVDDDRTHQPAIDDGEECVCLVMTQGPLKMKGLLPKIVQPIIGV